MYQIGQFRRTQIKADEDKRYVSEINLTLSTEESSLIPSVYNVCGVPQNILIANNSYYIHFSVKQKSAIQHFKLKLLNTTIASDNEQTIEYITVAAAIPNQQQPSYVDFELVFTPNASYNKIVWELQSNDVNDSINVSYFGKVEDIISSYLSSHFSDLTALIKIGVQGPPGLIMCINGEQIRLGRNGIYEINNGLKITSIGFVPKDSDYFIMDFEY